MEFYTNKEAFLAKIDRIVSQSELVSVDDTAVARLAGYIPKQMNMSGLFTPYLEQEGGVDSHDHLKRVLYSVALNVANQCGCVYPDANGNTCRWEIDGSAAKAVDDKLFQMLEDGDLPNWDNPWIEPLHLDAHLAGVPYAEVRKKIFTEFTNEKAKQVISDILDDARMAEDNYSFTFKHTEWLVREFPESFGANLFRKKANLVPITFAAYAQHKGIEVALDVMVPTDYRIPQTLHVAGVLDYSAELVQAIESGTPFDENSQEVEEIRAACIVVVQMLMEQSGLPMLDIDGYLWQLPKTSAMQQLKKDVRGGKTLPCTEKPITCYTMHF